VRAGAGWDGLQGGCGLEACEAGAGKISQNPASARRVYILWGESGQNILTRARLYCENTAALDKLSAGK